MRIAIIGTGIAGNAAAYALHGGADLTIYERELRPGGHCATLDIDHDRRKLAVDTGFIVYNELNYPNLTALFAELGTATEPSDMSFALSVDGGRFEWCGGERDVVRALFAQRRNVVSPRFWLMLKELRRFQATARADHAGDGVGSGSLGAYLDRHRFSQRFREAYLLPMGAAIWSSSPQDILAFPAHSFITFFANHRLLQWGRPKWRTVTGGSRRYVEAMTAAFRERIRLGTAALAVRRLRSGVEVVDSRGGADRFDHVVIAAHAPDALGMLADASDAERSVLGACPAAANSVYLHRDARLMPKRRAAWGSWNVLWDSADATRPVAVTYWMNRLQNLDTDRPIFVSLNPPFAPDAALTFSRMSYAHPRFDAAGLAARMRLKDIQGLNRTWFCGAWTGYGFHEDGLVSGLAVAEALGGGVAWRPQFRRSAHEAAA